MAKGIEEYDLNKDGKLTDEEIAQQKELREIQLREEKAETQKGMAKTAMVSMLVFTVLLFLPVFSDSRIEALADVLGLFYVAQAGVVGAYMGFTTWMSRK